MSQAKHQITYTEIRRVPKGQRIFLGELISGGGDQPPWPSWTEGMLAPYDCIVYERSEGLLYDRVEARAQSVECDPNSDTDRISRLASLKYFCVGIGHSLCGWGVTLECNGCAYTGRTLRDAIDREIATRAGGTTE